MGAFKDLLIRADDGDDEAIMTLAECSENSKNYKEAIKWYSKLGHTKKVEELREKLTETNKWEYYG